MMKKNLLLILMCFVCGLVYAHDGLNFRNLDVKSGISDNYVRSVLRDQYGFMWFATLNGLNRYGQKAGSHLHIHGQTNRLPIRCIE